MDEAGCAEGLSVVSRGGMQDPKQARRQGRPAAQVRQFLSAGVEHRVRLFVFSPKSLKNAPFTLPISCCFFSSRTLRQIDNFDRAAIALTYSEHGLVRMSRPTMIPVL